MSGQAFKSSAQTEAGRLVSAPTPNRPGHVGELCAQFYPLPSRIGQQRIGHHFGEHSARSKFRLSGTRARVRHHNFREITKWRLMSRIRIALFEGPAQAKPIQQRLMQVGIPAEVHNESRLAQLWYVSLRRAGARLEVSAKDAELARELLLEWDGDQAVQSAIRCPECKSLRVDYPQFTQKSLFTNFAMGLVAELGLLEREYYCEDCHCMWAKQNPRRRRIRQHMAPDYFLVDVQRESPVGAVSRREAGGALGG